MTAKLHPRDTLVIATHNAGKLREIEAMLAPWRLRLRSAADLGLAEPEETGATFEQNAAIKAVAAAINSNLPALGDDVAHYEKTKGSLHFAIDKPIPKRLVKKLVTTRMRQLGLV